MSTKKVVILLIVIIAVAVLGYGKVQKRRATVTPPAPSAVTSPIGDAAMQNLPVATGNVDETVDAVLAGVAEENQLLLEESSDADLINAEVDALNQYGQSYVSDEL
ncbi:MAG: hypothetical protein Q8R30_04810 [bacterium]|nr:hypothetical protein [bacterium]MDZ4285471.1 hypothetical protein [Candidatus Sungbacteria bacterium]